jgi:hypothetical protein
MVSRGAFPAQDMPDGASEAGTQQSDPCRSTTNWPSSLAMPMLPISTAAHSAQAPSLVCAARGFLRATAIVTASARCTMLLGSRGVQAEGRQSGVWIPRVQRRRRGMVCAASSSTEGGREDTRGRQRGRQRALEDAMRRRPTFIASMCMRKGMRPATRPLWRARAGMRESRRLRRGCSCDCSAPHGQGGPSPAALAAQQPSPQQRPASSHACQCHPSAIPAPSQQRIPAAP